MSESGIELHYFLFYLKLFDVEFFIVDIKFALPQNLAGAT